MTQQQTPEQRAVQLASDHWNGYIKGLLEAFGVDLSRVHGYNYITAFCHGYKHAVEDMRERRFDTLPLEEPPTVGENGNLCDSCRQQGRDCSGDTVVECSGHIPLSDKVGRSGQYIPNLCPSCQRDPGCIGEYPATSDGGCEGYISDLRERMLDAASPCDTCAAFPCDDLGGKAVKCSNWKEKVAEAKQDAPKTDEPTPAHTDPATNCMYCLTWCANAGLDVTLDLGCAQFQPKRGAK